MATNWKRIVIGYTLLAKGIGLVVLGYYLTGATSGKIQASESGLSAEGDLVKILGIVLALGGLAVLLVEAGVKRAAPPPATEPEPIAPAPIAPPVEADRPPEYNGPPGA